MLVFILATRALIGSLLPLLVPPRLPSPPSFLPVQEIVLQGRPMDIFYYQLWVAFFQLVFSTLTWPAFWFLEVRTQEHKTVPQTSLYYCSFVFISCTQFPPVLEFAADTAFNTFMESKVRFYRASQAAVTW